LAVSSFAKYLPGNIAQHVGRAALAKKEKIPVAVTVSTILLEAGWLVGCGASLAIVSMLLWPPDAKLTIPSFQNISVIETLVLVICLSFFVPFLMTFGFFRYAPKLIKNVNWNLEPNRPMANLLTPMGLYVANFLLMGMLLTIFIKFVFDMTTGHYFQTVGVFAFAWIAGFIVPGAPGGLGIREALMLALLGPIYGEPTTVALAILHRIVSAVSDAVVYLAGLIMMSAKKTFR
jgi:uncharacterized membrane protein YbhN (UPF0104 family)